MLALLMAQACVHRGQRSASGVGTCARGEAERNALVASVRFLSDSSGSSWAPGSRRSWPFVGAALSEIHVVEDDRMCGRILGALHSAYGVKADSIAVVEVRGAYIAFVVPRENGTYVLDGELRVLDLLVVPS